MSEDSAPVAEVVSYALPADAPAAMTVSEAARMLAEARRAKTEPPPAESAPQATAEEPELAVEADADAPQEPPGEFETQEPDPADDLPPIEPPRSWTKAEKERFASLPRETQEYLHTREQERDREFRRSQNEIADQRKAAQAEREAAEGLKQQYHAQLTAAQEALQDVHSQQYSSIKSMADVEVISNAIMQAANEGDVTRAAQLQAYLTGWQTLQQKLNANKIELDRLNGEKAVAKLGKRASYEAEQNKLLVELVPEMADPKKASELRERAVNMLTDDLGLKNDQLSRWYADDTGHEILSNAAIQKLIADGLKYRDMLKAPKAVATKPLPPVQRPGVARGGNPSVTLQIQNLESQLSKATGNQAIRLAADLTRLKRTVAR